MHACKRGLPTLAAAVQDQKRDTSNACVREQGMQEEGAYLGSIVGAVVEDIVVGPAALEQPVLNLNPSADECHTVHARHDCLLHQLAAYVPLQPVIV